MTLATDGSVDVSVLVPALDEAETLPVFLEQCADALADSASSDCGSPRVSVVIAPDGPDGRGSAVGELPDPRQRAPARAGDLVSF